MSKSTVKVYYVVPRWMMAKLPEEVLLLLKFYQPCSNRSDAWAEFLEFHGGMRKKWVNTHVSKGFLVTFEDKQ